MSRVVWSVDVEDWSALNPGIAGANGNVSVVAVAPNGDLYAGGKFTAIGDVAANRVARWDGKNWSALGEGVYGTGSEVRAIAFDTAGNVYVGGYFEVCGGLNTGSVARWDRKNWSTTGGGVHGSVYSLVPGDSGGVVAGGLFRLDPNSSTALQVANWNGKDWSQVGAVGPGGTVQAMLRRKDGSLLACGDHVVRWTGSVWQQMGTSIPACDAIAEDRQGTLYIGGSFDDGVIGATKIWGVARWDGTDWKPFLDGPIEMVKSLTTDSVGNLYVAGLFDSAAGIRTQGLAKWDGKAWSDVGGSLSKGKGYALALDSTGALVVGGSFLVAGDLGAKALARWDGSRWSTYGKGINGPVNAVAWDRKGRLYVGGEFTATAGGRANSVAMWDGQSWNSLGGGLGVSGAMEQATVNAMVTDSSGNLYVGGTFESAGGIPAKSLAKWDGRTWSALGGPDNSYGLPEVDALALDRKGHLYAGGLINSIGGVLINGIGVWDGSTWTSLGDSRSGQELSLVFDSQNRLVVGGRGINAPAGYSGYANTVVRHDDTGWTSLAKSSDERVRALACLPDGRIVAGGDFTSIGGKSASGIAAWNGSTWEKLPQVFATKTASFAVDRDGNIAAGTTYSNSNYLNEFRDGAWSVKTAPDGNILAMAFDSAGRLAIGGEFGSMSYQGGTQSTLYTPYLAVRGPTTVSVTPPARRASALDGKAVRLDVTGFDGRRMASREIASWSLAAESAALRPLGRGTWLVRRIAGGAKSEASLVVVP